MRTLVIKKIPPAIAGDRIWLLVRLVINSFAQAATAVANAQLVELAFDQLITKTNPNFNRTAPFVGLGFVAVAVVIAILRITERRDAERLGQQYSYEVRMTLYNHLSSLSPRILQQRTQGGMMLKFVSDLTALRKWVSLGFARLTVASTTTLAALLLLSTTSWKLALTVTIILTIGAFTIFKLGKQMQTKAKQTRRRLSDLAANINEKIASMAVVQVFGQSKHEKKRIARQSRDLEAAMISRSVVTGQLRGATEATTAIASGAALLVGAIEIAAGHATPGTIVAAMTIVSFLVSPLRDLGRVQEYWHNSRVAVEKLQEFLATPSLVTEIPNAPNLVLGSGCLEFNQVSLEGVLDEITFTARPGQIVALVGPNGAGKSTLVSLAARLIDPDRGTICLDGQNLATHRLASVRRAIGIASPDLPLLRGTVRKNLHYRCRNASKQEIDRVWDLCGIEELLSELPEGENTRISEGGKGLSAGQKQRIALARAILGNPRLLLLDEVDANLDPQATAVLERILSQHHGTVLLITHRFERLILADVIWYLENGRLLESGSPQHLLKTNGYTANLFQSPLSRTEK